MSPIINVGYDTIDVRELVHVGPAGVPHENIAAFTVTFKSGAERTLHSPIPEEDFPRPPKPEDFQPDEYYSKAALLEAVRMAKQQWREAVAALAGIERARIIAAWRQFA